MTLFGNSNHRTNSFLGIALLFIVTSAFTCVEIRDLKHTNKVSAETNALQVQGWSLGKSNLLFDFALRPTDSLQREVLKDPKLTKFHLTIDTAIYHEELKSLLNGRRRTFSKKIKDSTEEVIMISIESKNRYQQIKKENYPMILTVEVGDEKKTYSFAFK